VPLTGEYEPSPRKQTREQVEQYEATDGREANTLAGTSWPVVMRVEHDGKYAMVASMGGAPKHPEWYLNLKADREALMVQDGADRFEATARELEGEEREIWWRRAVEAYPPYARYQEKTDRQIPVLLVERK
jgi:deazaflavin-dependent oxidoreductase (nitroreductase family)